MSRVPLLYFSRGQLESVDWPDAVVELAARICKRRSKERSRYDQALEERSVKEFHERRRPDHGIPRRCRWPIGL